MIDSNLPPSRQLHFFARLARWSLGLLLAFWLLLSAMAWVLHGFIVPRIGDWRTDIERIASNALGAPVKLDRISAHSNHWLPSLELQGLTFLHPQGQQALRLQNVTVTVSARSLLRLGFEQIYIDAPQLDIRRLQQGDWQIAGFTLASASNSSDHKALRWLLDQPEVVIRQGTVTFTDDMRNVPPVSLERLDFFIRNGTWRHQMRLDAYLQGNADDHIQLQGTLRTPLIPSSAPAWERWNGQWYVQLETTQLPALPWPASLPVAEVQGQGRTRAWFDVAHGRTQSVTADIALAQAKIRWQAPERTPLDIRNLQTRVRAQWHQDAWQVQANDFEFESSQSGHWQPSQWSVKGKSSRIQELRIDRADLHLLHQVANSFALPASLSERLAHLQPTGLVKDFTLTLPSAGQYRGQGAVEQLTLEAQPRSIGVGTPGLQDASGSFTFDHQGGRADIAMQAGTLTFPGVFEAPTIEIEALSGIVQWQMQPDGMHLEVPKLEFRNADAQGTLQARWQPSAAPYAPLPGYLDLQGSLERANGAQVYRYLPLAIPASARHYVRDSVLQGEGKAVEFEVRGNLKDMPFTEPQSGTFRIRAPVHNVVYQFVPPGLQPKEQAPWQTLEQLQGTLLFEGQSMHVLAANSRIKQHRGLMFTQVDAHIPEFKHPVLTVSAQGEGDLGGWLATLGASPLSAFTSHALDSAQGSGQAHVNFQMALPLRDVASVTVQGAAQLQGNGFQFSPDTPKLEQTYGKVTFGTHGFQLHALRAQTLGGAVHIHGGMGAADAGVHIAAQGLASAAALRAASQLPVVPWIAQHANGESAYQLQVDAQNGERVITVRSDLQGMALDLPAPLGKLADSAWPLEVRFQQSADAQQEIEVHVAERAKVFYQRNAAVQPARIVSGHIAIGQLDSATSPPHSGVTASIHLPALDMDAWKAVLVSASTPSAAPDNEWTAYLPHTLTLNTQQLHVQQRDIADVQATIREQGGLWQAQLQSPHFAGQVQYQPPNLQYGSGRIFARLSHLLLPKSEVAHLQNASTSTEDPKSLPALDIQVERLQIGHLALGQLHLRAVNQVRAENSQWLLEQFDLQTPEAHWQASGYWSPRTERDPPLTHLNFNLQITDAGQLLTRMGLEKVIRQGNGKIHGQIGWNGAPISPDWDSMNGQLQLDVGKGQFLKVEPGMGKLLSVLSLQSLSRRLTLDFRDVFSQGFAFDSIQGNVQVTSGIARTHNLQMQGLNAAVLMEGHASLSEETQQLKVVVVPEINAMTASLAATAVNPVVGLGSFLAQWLLRGPLMEAATRSFYIHGAWRDPVVEPLGKDKLWSPLPQ